MTDRRQARLVVYAGGGAELGGRRYRCALGRGGVRPDKTEGDGATPAGCYPMRRVLFRRDRLAPPATGLPLQPIARNDGWCDDPQDAAYNRPVSLPYAARHEEMWRDDRIYDLVVILGHNDDPPIPGRGSAIFLHVASPGYGPTEGCIALAPDDLLSVLRDCGPGAAIEIRPEPSA